MFFKNQAVCSGFPVYLLELLILVLVKCEMSYSVLVYFICTKLHHKIGKTERCSQIIVRRKEMIGIYNTINFCSLELLNHYTYSNGTGVVPV